MVNNINFLKFWEHNDDDILVIRRSCWIGLQKIVQMGNYPLASPITLSFLAEYIWGSTNPQTAIYPRNITNPATFPCLTKPIHLVNQCLHHCSFGHPYMI